MEQSDIQQRAKLILQKYMETKEMRKTPERYAILNAVYKHNGHFTADDMLVQMEEEGFHVSRATMYSALELFIEAELVVRHQFGNVMQYEKSLGVRYHHHRVCIQCGTITEFTDAAIDAAIEKTRKPRFRMTSSAVYLYGVCSKCQNRLKRAEKQQTRSNKQKK